MLSSAMSMIPRAMRVTPALARAAPMARVSVTRMPVAFPAMARSYASASGPSLDEIKSRINEVLKSFEKVDPAQITPSASFQGDLGLDSLDAVEVVMAIEEEFNIVRMTTDPANCLTNRRRFLMPMRTPSPLSSRLWTTSRTRRMVRISVIKNAV